MSLGPLQSGDDGIDVVHAASPGSAADLLQSGPKARVVRQGTMRCQILAGFSLRQDSCAFLGVETREEVQVDDQQHVENVRAQHAEYDEVGTDANGDVAIAEAATKKKPIVRPTQKVGRNDPCPCGSGKKYKHCHGKLT